MRFVTMFVTVFDFALAAPAETMSWHRCQPTNLIRVDNELTLHLPLAVGELVGLVETRRTFASSSTRTQSRIDEHKRIL
jgi:hypothetical protein